MTSQVRGGSGGEYRGWGGEGGHGGGAGTPTEDGGRQ